MKCDGSCEEHIGEVVKVHVITSSGYDWGYFFYCENAIEEDIRRGMTIIIVGDEEQSNEQ